MTERQLLDLKNKITEAKQTTSELKGHQSALLKQLREDWDCDSVEKAEKMLEKMDREITSLDENIEKLMNELEEKYNG